MTGLWLSGKWTVKGPYSVKSFEVSLQFIELYQEVLRDLLGQRKGVDVSALGIN